MELRAAVSLGIEAPTSCIALEDSLNGVLAAKAACMRVIAIPEAALRDDPCYAIADLRLSSLLELTLETWVLPTGQTGTRKHPR